MECYSCDMSCESVVSLMYYEEIRLINKLLNADLVSVIGSYLYHLDGHDVTHDVKHLIDNESGCDDFYNMRCTDTVCTFCFQKGLALSLKDRQELPYLRKDFGYFLSNRSITDIKQTFKSFVLPENYYCTYYATPFMIENEDGIIHIGYNSL